MILYGLRNTKTKEILHVEEFSNEGGEFCCSVGFEFSVTGDIPYLVSFDDIVKVMVDKVKTDWYNASYRNPKSDFVNLDDYEIYEVDFSVENVKIN